MSNTIGVILFSATMLASNGNVNIPERGRIIDSDNSPQTYVATDRVGTQLRLTKEACKTNDAMLYGYAIDRAGKSRTGCFVIYGRYVYMFWSNGGGQKFPVEYFKALELDKQ